MYNIAFRARCCGLILSLITRLLRLAGGEGLVDVQPKQPRQQPDRLLLDLGWQRLKRRTRGWGMKQRGLRESRWVHEPGHQHLLQRARNDAGLVAQRRGPNVA